MANTPIVYVFCDQNCKFVGMTKEQILTAIMQAVESGEITDVDAGFITTIKTINNVALKFFYGEKAAYDALTAEQKENLFPIITNDTFKGDINAAIETLKTDLEELQEKFENGDIVVAKAKAAETADTATNAGHATSADTATTASLLNIGFKGLTLNSDNSVLKNVVTIGMYIFLIGWPDDNSTYDTVEIGIQNTSHDVRSTQSCNGYCAVYNGSATEKKILFSKDGEWIKPSKVYYCKIF